MYIRRRCRRGGGQLERIQCTPQTFKKVDSKGWARQCCQSKGIIRLSTRNPREPPGVPCVSTRGVVPVMPVSVSLQSAVDIPVLRREGHGQWRGCARCWRRDSPHTSQVSRSNTHRTNGHEGHMHAFTEIACGERAGRVCVWLLCAIDVCRRPLL